MVVYNKYKSNGNNVKENDRHNMCINIVNDRERERDIIKARVHLHDDDAIASK